MERTVENMDLTIIVKNYLDIMNKKKYDFCVIYQWILLFFMIEYLQ